MIIYKATNKVNGKSYIGQTVRTLKVRKEEHLRKLQRDDYYFHRAIIKYGRENFVWEELERTENKIKLEKLEIYYIKLYDTYNNGYNLTVGGEKGTLGFKHSEKSKKQMSKNKKGKYIGKDNHYFGKKHTEEIREKMRGPRPSIQGKLHPRFGKTLSAEQKKKISDNHADFSGGKHPQARSIILIHPDGKEELFNSMVEAEEKYNLYKGSVSGIIRGHQKQTKGFKCRYANSGEVMPV